MRDTPIYTIGGAVQPGSGRYIARQADEELLALCREGAFVYILAARQMGKSSLMLRTAERLDDEGIRSVQIDLSLIGTQVDAESWYFGLLFEFRRQLGLKSNLLDWWQAHADLGSTQRFSLFCEEVLPRKIAGALVIFVDEARGRAAEPDHALPRTGRQRHCASFERPAVGLAAAARSRARDPHRPG